MQSGGLAQMVAQTPAGIPDGQELVVAEPMVRWRVASYDDRVTGRMVIEREHRRRLTFCIIEAADASPILKHQRFTPEISDAQIAQVLVGHINGWREECLQVVRQSRAFYLQGRPGMRPRCGYLRKQYVSTYRTFVGWSYSFITLYQSYLELGIATAEQIPEWLTTGLEEMRREPGVALDVIVPPDL